MGLNPGQSIPDFTLPDQSGSTRDFAGLTGENGLVLYVYPRDNTSGCSLEAQEFRDRLSDFKALGYAVAGISKDSVKSHVNFAGKFDLNFPLLSDPERSLLEPLGAWGEKKSYGKTTMGVIRSTWVFDSGGRVMLAYSGVKAKGHAEKVLRDVEGLAPAEPEAAGYWLVKSEAKAYSWDDLVAEGRTVWDGVRNHQARGNIGRMKPGDRVLFYHSGRDRKVVGTARVVSAPYPDPTSDDTRWLAVDVEPVKPLPEPVPLAAIKAEPDLAEMGLVRQSRLSVMPVTEAEYQKVIALGGGSD